MDLIYTNSSMQAIGVMKAYDLDLAFGSDENDFEIKVDANNHCCEAGYYVYIIGTEYGGVIDAVTSDTQTGEVTYTGRTWHGILNSKVICPDAGQDYLTLNNEANGVLDSLITRMGLTSIFTVNIYASGLEISNYKMPRYVTGYDGIMQMLKSVGGKLVLSFDGEKIILSAAPIADHTKDGSVSSDAMSFQVKKTSKKINHLICLGQGELKDRTVVHLYADASGSISQTQTLTGADEYAAVYDYQSAESAQKLIEAGASRLAELQNQDNLSVSLNEAGYAFDVGDVVGAVDTVTGISVSVPITKKIVSIRNDYMSVSYETATGKAGTSSSGQIGGSGVALGGTDYIIEQGDTGKWRWRKWASGIAEMWATFDAPTLTMTSQTWGALYTASWMGLAANKAAREYPFAFTANPVVSATPTVGSGNIWLATNTENDIGTRLTHAPAYQCVRASDATVNSPQISYYVVGKYK
nr:MAG TPA: Protein gp18.1, prophage tail protein gp18.7A [Caudoviricetes sp.]